MSVGSDTVMTVAPDSHRIPYYLPGKKPFVPHFRYSVKVKYSINGEEMQEGKRDYENKKGCDTTRKRKSELKRKR